jgi:hypothetical protein
MNSYRFTMRTGLAALMLLTGSVWAAATEIEAGLPEKTSAVVTINLKQLLRAPVLKEHGLASLEQLCRNTAAVRAVLEMLGLDPRRDLDRLTLAGVGCGNKVECVLILRGRFDTARIYLAEKNLVKHYGDRFAMHKDDELKYVSLIPTGGHGAVVFGTGVNSKKNPILNVQTKGCLLDAFPNACIALVDKNTLVAASSEELLKETSKRISGETIAAPNKPMRRLLAELDGKQTILFALRPDGAASGPSHSWACGRPDAGAGQMPPISIPPPLPTLAPDLLKGPEIENPKLPPLPPPASLAPLPEPLTRASMLFSSPSAYSQEPPFLEKQPEPSKSKLRELSGSINVSDDFKLRCTLRTAGGKDAKEAMNTLDDLRLRTGGLAMFLAGNNKNYAFLKEIPSAFLAVRKGNIILIEGHLPAETVAKLLGAFQQ